MTPNSDLSHLIAKCRQLRAKSREICEQMSRLVDESDRLARNARLLRAELHTQDDSNQRQSGGG
jgi:hypothetical protein